MKKILIVLALVALTMSACGSTTSDTSKSSSPQTPSRLHDVAVPIAGMPGLSMTLTRFEIAITACLGPDQSAINLIYASAISDSGRAMHLTVGSGEQSDVTFVVVACVLRELSAPSSIELLLDRTTAAMGPQTYSWNNIEATWTYAETNIADFMLVDKYSTAPSETASAITDTPAMAPSVPPTPEEWVQVEPGTVDKGKRKAITNNANLVSFLVGGTVLAEMPEYVTCMTNLVGDVVVAMSSSGGIATFRRQTGGVDTPRYKHGLALITTVVAAHHLTKPAASHVNPIVVRQWLLDIQGPKLTGGCPLG